MVLTLEQLKDAAADLPVRERAELAQFLVRTLDESEAANIFSGGIDAAAVKVRRKWMGEMGLSAEEVDESCRDDPPTSLDEELRQLQAVLWLKVNTPPSATMQAWATKY
ncbi:MAG: hypothetical protein K2R98_04170 [Gemmataceae bacterium]|nr:hypothetical protein [Gemmataceae bacterium]